MTIAEKLQKVAENEQKVFDAGKKAEYDTFWDAYQNNGEPKNYTCAFYNNGWTTKIYKPKYDIVGNEKNQDNIFAYSSIEDTMVTVDLTATTIARSIFNYCDKLKTIRLLRINEHLDCSNWFNYCYALENLTIEGTIGQNGFNVQWSPLTHDSLVSIIDALQDKSTDTSETVWTVTLGVSNTAKLSEEDVAKIHDKGWQIG